MRFRRFSRVGIYIFVILFAAIFFLSVSNQRVFAEPEVRNSSFVHLVPKGRVCSITDCEMYFKNSDMVVTCITENLRKNYNYWKIMATCDNKPVYICIMSVWKLNDNRNEECKLLVNSTSGHASVIVHNGMKYKSCINMLCEFDRSVNCGVPGGSGQKEILKAVDRGGITTEQSSPNPTNITATNTTAINSTAINSSPTKSAGGAVKNSTDITPTTPAEDKTRTDQPCSAAMNTLRTSPIMLALIFFLSLYF
ncbi:Hypothetical predicted protein [Paramuricea clavata]|uniref:Uncharacterized protein n=1 Tax=Paramuricea clavata TaxID=317549 RepID=A0A7D9LZI7_PARCT|nr:Hypothetical predicted protein [Paramuricea clavata]